MFVGESANNRTLRTPGRRCPARLGRVVSRAYDNKSYYAYARTLLACGRKRAHAGFYNCRTEHRECACSPCESVFVCVAFITLYLVLAPARVCAIITSRHDLISAQIKHTRRGATHSSNTHGHTHIKCINSPVSRERECVCTMRGTRVKALCLLDVIKEARASARASFTHYGPPPPPPSNRRDNGAQPAASQHHLRCARKSCAHAKHENTERVRISHLPSPRALRNLCSCGC